MSNDKHRDAGSKDDSKHKDQASQAGQKDSGKTGGSGNFKDDPKRASEAGKKGGKA